MIKKRFFLPLLFISFPLFSATIVVDGKNYECQKKSSEFFQCPNGKNPILVKKNGFSFVAVSSPKKDELVLHKVSKVSEGIRVYYEESGFGKKTFPDFSLTGLADRTNVATTVIENFKNEKDPTAVEFFNRAKAIKDEDDAKKVNKVTVNIGNPAKSLNCQRGESTSSAAALNTQCAYFTCEGNNSEEKILAFLPNLMESYRPAEILTMKNGQAELVQSNFKVVTDNKVPFMDVPAYEDYTEDKFIDKNLFVPSKYDLSKSSFNELINTPTDLDPYAQICRDPIIHSFIEEKNKIIKEMKDSLSSADIIEYLKMNGGNIQSFYVDRQKAQALGCLYNNKILDAAVLQHLDYLKSISTVSAASKKYLSLKEVQALFKKASNMKDIPFGYKYDGCYARAHIMARRFEAEGIPTQKVWIKGDLFVPGTDIEWNYHVAPIVDVKEDNGEIKKYVIDPSLNQKAVPIDEWVASMGSKLNGPVMKTTYPFPANSANFQRTTVAISSSDPFAPIDIRELDEKTKIDQAKMVLSNFAQALKESK